MSTTPRKSTTPVGPRSANTDSTDNTGASPNGVPSRIHSRSPSTAANGLSRTPSTRGGTPVSARAAARKPGRTNLSMSSVPRINSDPSEEDMRAQNAVLIAELKEQLHKAETVSEQYRKQLGVLQMRLDDAVSEQGKLEDQGHEKDTKIEALENEIREHVRQIRDLEMAREVERNAMIEQKEQQARREEELQVTIQRLKETIAQKDTRILTEGDRTNDVSRSSSFRNRSSPDLNAHFAPSSAHLERSPSRNNSKLLLQKDKLIESLRLELAESQIKLVEMENNGGGRVRELEKELLEARMANARLMEDNESYQLLLSERTLNGDFARGDFMREAHPETKESSSKGVGSLADELESIDERAETTDSARKREAEIKTLKEQNKALTLYIERIISRLLQYDGLEHILDKNESDPLPKPASSMTEKELPPTPPERDDATGKSLLQRAKSIMSGPSIRPRPQQPRPMSFMSSQPPTSVSTPHENPDTAPSIPLNRPQPVRSGAGHRRSRSDQADNGAAAVIGQMYRGRNSGGPMSPTSLGPGSRQGLFTGASYTGSTGSSNRAASLSSQPDQKRPGSSNSVASDGPGDTISSEATSSPRSSSGMTNYTGAVMTQNRLRPLRLVQETNEAAKAAEDEEIARKKANRTSWIPGWFNRANTEEIANP